MKEEKTAMTRKEIDALVDFIVSSILHKILSDKLVHEKIKEQTDIYLNRYYINAHDKYEIETETKRKLIEKLSCILQSCENNIIQTEDVLRPILRRILKVYLRGEL